VGFALRFGFVIWKHTYVRAPGAILPFVVYLVYVLWGEITGRLAPRRVAQ